MCKRCDTLCPYTERVLSWVVSIWEVGPSFRYATSMVYWCRASSKIVGVLPHAEVYNIIVKGDSCKETDSGVRPSPVTSAKRMSITFRPLYSKNGTTA